MAKRTKKIAPISVETVEAFEIISATAELDAGDFDKQPQSDRNLDEIAEALEAEDRDDDRSFGEDLAEPFILDADTITFRIHPTEAEMRRVLASIDPAMESAVTAGVVDHESQSASWIPEETAAEIQLDAIVAVVPVVRSPENSSTAQGRNGVGRAARRQASRWGFSGRSSPASSIEPWG